MINEETKHYWIRLGIAALVFFIVAYLAFHVALKNHLRNLSNPFYQTRRMEKVLDKQFRDFDRFEEKYLNNPFEPKMRPMFVNLVKESSEYKVIVDLAEFDGDEKAVNVAINGDELTVSGKMDKKIRGNEKIISFTQTYYLDEKLDENKLLKERKGDKYIITIPFKITEREDD